MIFHLLLNSIPLLLTPTAARLTYLINTFTLFFIVYLPCQSSYHANPTVSTTDVYKALTSLDVKNPVVSMEFLPECYAVVLEHCVYHCIIFFLCHCVMPLCHLTGKSIKLYLFSKLEIQHQLQIIITTIQHI